MFTCKSKLASQTIPEAALVSGGFLIFQLSVKNVKIVSLNVWKLSVKMLESQSESM